METAERLSLTSLLSERLRARAEEIASEWLARLLERLPERPHDIFPDRNLLNHIPELVDRISLSLSSEAEVEDLLSAEILHEVRLLAQLRRAQGYDLKELLVELEVLGEVVAGHILDMMNELERDASPAESMRVASRLQRVIFAMGLVAADIFLAESVRSRLRRTEILAAFARAVTHELRNLAQPALLGLSLARGHLAAGRRDEADAALARVESSISRIDALPNDLLALALGQKAPIAYPVRSEPLARVIRRTIDSLLPYAGVHDVAVSIEGELPDSRVDAGKLQLVCVNLISNGIKHRDLDKPERWVKVSARVESTGPGEWVSVEVEDNGIGIPDDQLVTLFDDRFRAHSEEPYAGRGLGLALAHEALLQLGSQLHVESVVGGGCRFRFRLPLSNDGSERKMAGS